MTAVALFDVFFVFMGGWGVLRLLNTIRTKSVVWQSSRFTRSDSEAAFWSVTAFNIALVAGSIYFIAIG